MFISQPAAEMLRKTHFFASLDDNSIKSLLEALRVKDYSKGDMILQEGERDSNLYFVLSGVAKSYKISPDGKEQIISLLKPGDIFNMTTVVESKPQVYDVDAMSPVTLAYVSKNEMYALMNENSNIYEALLRLYADEIRYLITLVEDLSFRTVMGRVAKILLLYMSDAYGRHVRITQRDMAAMAGTAREVVSRALRTLENDGYIIIDHNRINILEPEALQDMVESSV